MTTTTTSTASALHFHQQRTKRVAEEAFRPPQTKLVSAPLIWLDQWTGGTKLSEMPEMDDILNPTAVLCKEHEDAVFANNQCPASPPTLNFHQQRTKRDAEEALGTPKMNGASAPSTDFESDEAPPEWLDQWVAAELSEMQEMELVPEEAPPGRLHDSLLPGSLHAPPASKKPKTKHNLEVTKTKTKTSQMELLIDVFQAPKATKAEFKFATYIPYLETINAKFLGCWSDSFSSNNRTNHTYCTYSGEYEKSKHALIRIYQQPLENTNECLYKVLYSKILFWQIEALHVRDEEFCKKTAVVMTYVSCLSDNYMLQFFDFTRSKNPQPNHKEQLEKAKDLMSLCQVNTNTSIVLTLQYKKGSIIVVETGGRELNLSSATCSSDDYTEALVKYVHRVLPNTVTIKGNTVDFDHSRFSATVDDGRLNLTWCISVINNIDADLENGNHKSIIELMQLGKLGDHLTSAFLASIDKKLAALERDISIEKKKYGFIESESEATFECRFSER